MRRTLAIGLLMTGVIGVVPAVAQPVTPGRMAQVAFAIPSASGVQLHVDVVTSTSTAGDRIEVSVARCRGGNCDMATYYGGPLPKGALSIDGAAAAARLRASLDGTPFVVDWTPVPPGTVAAQGLHGGGTDEDFAMTVYRADPALARVVLGGRSCRGSATVGDQVRIEVPEGSSGDDVPMARLRLPAGTPVCQS
jgi:hypothetical protein